MPRLVWTLDDGLHEQTERELKREIAALQSRLARTTAPRDRHRLLLKVRQLRTQLRRGDYAKDDDAGWFAIEQAILAGGSACKSCGVSLLFPVPRGKPALCADCRPLFDRLRRLHGRAEEVEVTLPNWL